MPTFMRCISSCPVSMRRIGHGLDGFLAMLAILALALAQTKPSRSHQKLAMARIDLIELI
jgi:hypothetical protein